MGSGKPLLAQKLLPVTWFRSPLPIRPLEDNVWGKEKVYSKLAVKETQRPLPQTSVLPWLRA